MLRQLCVDGGDVDVLFVLVEVSGDQVNDEVDEAHGSHEQVEVIEMVEVEVGGFEPAFACELLREGVDTHHEAAVLEEPAGDREHGEGGAQAAHADGWLVVEKLEQPRVGEEDGGAHDHQDG